MGLGNALTSALVGLSIGLLVLAVVTQPRGVYLGTVVLSMGMALLYPSLMAFTVNSVSEEDRALALASFTMFFEVGTVAGGLILGTIARFTGEQGAFAGGAVMAMTGIWVLRRRLLPVAHLRRPLVAAPAAPVFDGGLSVGE
jgi:MFS family permease